ncbi:trehalose-phosphatase [Intrasporangium sp. DVR]|uniref:trehalose-phosphatase n=1 Tax=Intrasporangium sp. DVR TaxID=3127867 RepID=UPI00313A5C60
MNRTATLHDALDVAASAPGLLVATDFDGVLAPFDVDPMAVRATPGGLEALRALAALPATTVALVSGRDLDTLRALTGVAEAEPIVLIGSHGAESSNDDVREAMEAAAVTQEDKEVLDSLTTDITRLISERHPRASLEHKAAAIVVHTRGLDDDIADAAVTEARELALGRPGVKVLKGKSVLELSVSHADKGSAVTALGRARGVTSRVYFGDDVTDEDVFTRMTRPEDVTVKVGPGSTAARYRVDDEAAVVAALERLASAR